MRVRTREENAAHAREMRLKGKLRTTVPPDTVPPLEKRTTRTVPPVIASTTCVPPCLECERLRFEYERAHSEVATLRAENVKLKAVVSAFTEGSKGKSAKGISNDAFQEARRRAIEERTMTWA
jgi:hypothetical protein